MVQHAAGQRRRQRAQRRTAPRRRSAPPAVDGPHDHAATWPTSPAADPSLSVQQEDDNRLAMESGTAAFELNYPFVYPSMKANKPEMFKNFKWAPYPAVDATASRRR